MEDAYFTAFAPTSSAPTPHLAREAAANGGASAEARIRADRNAAEVVVAAPDREGLFADLAQAIAGLGGNVVGARIYTSSRGEALDVFYVQDVAGEPFGGRASAPAGAAGRGAGSRRARPRRRRWRPSKPRPRPRGGLHHRAGGHASTTTPRPTPR